MGIVKLLPGDVSKTDKLLPPISDARPALTDILRKLPIGKAIGRDRFRTFGESLEFSIIGDEESFCGKEQ